MPDCTPLHLSPILQYLYISLHIRTMQQLTKTLVKGRPFFDIAANLTDDQFGSNKHHHSDRDQVVQRAIDVGCSHLLIAAGCYKDAEHTFDLCNRYNNAYCTIGVHPCRANEPFKKDHHHSLEDYFVKLDHLAQKISSKLVAIGQCGLDYDRLHYSSKEEQLAVFPFHFQLAEKYKLPMYLHNRNTGDDFYNIVKENRHRFSTGVVHSFTGTPDEVKRIVELDLYIGVNGCSLKTQENIDTLKTIPLDRIMLETDSPYCQIRASHAGSKYVKTKFPHKGKRTEDYLLKGRNEPCKIVEVLEAVSSILGVPEQKLCQIAYANSMKMFSIK